MTDPENVRRPTLLASWKEIASYLRKGVRTVQRWEEEFGLPVRRPKEGLRRAVYALIDELDRWLATHWSQRLHTWATTVASDVSQLSAAQAQNHVIRELLRERKRLQAELQRNAESLARECQALQQSAGTSASQPEPPARSARTGKT
jgi:hypothetical protein